MENPPTDPLVIVAWIQSGFATLGILFTGIFTYLAVVQNRKEDAKKEITQPLKPVDVGRIAELEQLRREDGEAYAIALLNKDRQISDLNKIIAAHQVWALKLTRQLRHHAADVNPADYETPNGKPVSFDE